MILSRNTEGDTNRRNAEKGIWWIIHCRTDSLWEKGNRKVARLKKIWAVYTGRRVRTGTVVFSNNKKISPNYQPVRFAALLLVLHCEQSVTQSLRAGRHQAPPGIPWVYQVHLGDGRGWVALPDGIFLKAHPKYCHLAIFMPGWIGRDPNKSKTNDKELEGMTSKERLNELKYA